MNTHSRPCPQVTIITPAYNRESYLKETIESVLNQDYPNIEYIVLDDGSTDSSAEVVKKYKDKVIFESHPNMGETATVNKGFQMASGEFVGVVNSDDPLLPGAVRKIIEPMLSDPKIMVCYPDWNLIDGTGNLIRHISTPEHNFINMVRWFRCYVGPGAFFRKELVNKLRGRDGNFRYVADFDFWLRAGLEGSFKRIPEYLATFRHHEDSASVGSQGLEMSEEHLRLYHKFFSLPNLSENILALKKESLSSAYFVAGNVNGENWSFRRKKYYLKALWHSPLKYAGEYRKRLKIIIPVLFGSVFWLLTRPFKYFKILFKKLTK